MKTKKNKTQGNYSFPYNASSNQKTAAECVLTVFRRYHLDNVTPLIYGVESLAYESEDDKKAFFLAVTQKTREMLEKDIRDKKDSVGVSMTIDKKIPISEVAKTLAYSQIIFILGRYNEPTIHREWGPFMATMRKKYNLEKILSR